MSYPTETDDRDRRGEWHPPELLESPPLYAWPARPLATLKWIFGWQGLLFPWNAVFFLISLATWLWLTPAMDTMRHFAVGWIAFVLVRNFVLILLFVGAWHFRLYMQRAQDRKFKHNGRWLAEKSPVFLFGDQVYDNVFWTMAGAVPIWTAYEVLSLWAMANGYIPYVDFQEHPIYCGALFLFILFFREIYFYLVHRLLHWRPLYRAVHSLHHKNANPGPWSGLAMHPVEQFLYFSSVLVHWIVPSHPLHIIFHLQHLALSPAQGHSGFERVVVGSDGKAIQTGDYFHYLHHKYFECNYGADLVPIDQWIGTFHNGSKEGEARMNKRLKQRQQRQ